MKITIVGLGLIGGSMAKDLRKAGFATEIIGVDNNEEHLKRALELGIADRETTLEEGVKAADIVLVAIPVDKMLKVLPVILDHIDPATSVTDVSSTKKMICDAVNDHPRRGNFVAAHPMSGTENSGPDAAIEGLFEEKICIICDQEKSRPQHIALIEKLYHTIGMDIAYMSSDEQDHTTAHVSHLPHITAFAKHLEEFKQSLLNVDEKPMYALMKNANKIREILNGENQNLVRKRSTTTKLYTK